MRNSLRLMAVSVALWLSSNTGVATAGIFDEHTVNYQYYFPNLSTPYASAGNGNYLVDSGVEISDVVDGLGTIDFSGDQFTVSFSHSGSFSPTEFNGFVISDLTANINPFTAFTLISNTGVSSTPVLSFDSNHLYVNWEGLNYSRGGAGVRGGIHYSKSNRLIFPYHQSRSGTRYLCDITGRVGFSKV